ncbi:MAG: hypothetical protein HFJ12_02295 [Bacilli bacterium]|nr:hypothetical protein [Bacilli bacterium]
MRLYLKGKKVTIYPFLLKKIGYGTQGKIYRYHNRALKVIHPNVKDLTLRECQHLQNIKTKRILLPDDAFTDLYGTLHCYTTELIIEQSDIYIMIMDKFLEEIYQVEKELDLLSRHYVMVHDWIRKNFMFDGIFRFVDAGRYEFCSSKKISEIRNYNQSVFNSFILGEMITYSFYPDYALGFAKHPMLRQLETNYRESQCKTMGEYVESTMSKNENFLQYIKRLKTKI